MQGEPREVCNFLSTAESSLTTARIIVTHDYPIFRLGLSGAPEGTVKSALQEAKSAAFSDFVRRAALVSIHAYQVHLSPLKGFSCPYRHCYGGLSCSAYVSRLFSEENSLSMVFYEALERFRSCAMASQLLHSESSETHCWIIPCCLAL
jgi:putative component of membrane protein insertase Oxa1/YidC/SpoIIIJ protein YidD